ncbi:hypothetical protein RAH57_13660 [Chryseobacterium sp. CKR4-1]|uniref:hypothetical protein n=1 Tax=Chryseobacterium sp. CKR4-1 TaxID=3068896 RepID=UPI0027965ECE|nr:hypothetical protein [Chryseobacterium sp. CKR4-1]MDQ1805040.1 hypothetical protein [Chryseobacterium sp. CKR4-1]
MFDWTPFLPGESAEYDINENITKLIRFGDLDTNTGAKIDDIAYIYDGNLLTFANDSTPNPSGLNGGGAFTYDNDGRMITDAAHSMTAAEYNNMNLLKKISEITRWEDNEWEGFTQNVDDVDKDNLRVIPIATLLGIDSSLEPILKLGIEEGLWKKMKIQHGAIGNDKNTKVEVDSGYLTPVTRVPKESFKEKAINGAFDLATIVLAALGGPEGGH